MSFKTIQNSIEKFPIDNKSLEKYTILDSTEMETKNPTIVQI